VRARATYAYSLSEYMAFFRTCGELRPYEVAYAIRYSETLARLRWQLRGEGCEQEISA
jgi:hypothetical protein